MKLLPWALPVIPIVAAGIALAALIVNATKSTDWAIPGDIGAALCIVLAIGGVRLAVVSTSERCQRLRRAREVVNILLGTGKILQQQPGYQKSLTRLRALVGNGIPFFHRNDRLQWPAIRPYRDMAYDCRAQTPRSAFQERHGYLCA